MAFDTIWTKGEEISTDGFQVVSSQMFSNYSYRSEISCTLWYSSMSFSKKAVEALNCCERVRIEVNVDRKCLLIVPVTEKDKDGIVWVKNKRNQPTGKKMDCRLFTNQLFNSWGWDEKLAYRTTGRLVTSDNKVMMLFDFSNAENWEVRTISKDK